MGEIIVCPSGLAGEIRGLKTKEADLLAGANKKKRPAAIAKVLGDCWESTTDLGPYSSPLNWDSILQGDRTYALLAIRAATHGPKYIFKPQCPSQSCHSRFEWEIDLHEELPIRKMAEADKIQFAAANSFEATLPSSGKKVLYRLPTGMDEKRAMMMQSQGRQQMLTLSLRMRIDEIEGVDKNDLKNFISELGLGDANSLLEQFEEHDCGVETRIEVECPECFTTFDVELPFDQSFFFPSRQSPKSQKATLEAV